MLFNQTPLLKRPRKSIVSCGYFAIFASGERTIAMFCFNEIGNLFNETTYITPQDYISFVWRAEDSEAS